MLPVTRQFSHPAVVSGEEAQTGAGNTADGMGSAGHASSAVALWHAQVAVLAEEATAAGYPHCLREDRTQKCGVRPKSRRVRGRAGKRRGLRSCQAQVIELCHGGADPAAREISVRGAAGAAGALRANFVEGSALGGGPDRVPLPCTRCRRGGEVHAAAAVAGSGPACRCGDGGRGRERRQEVQQALWYNGQCLGPIPTVASACTSPTGTKRPLPSSTARSRTTLATH